MIMRLKLNHHCIKLSLLVSFELLALLINIGSAVAMLEDLRIWTKFCCITLLLLLQLWRDVSYDMFLCAANDHYLLASYVLTSLAFFLTSLLKAGASFKSSNNSLSSGSSRNSSPLINPSVKRSYLSLNLIFQNKSLYLLVC